MFRGNPRFSRIYSGNRNFPIRLENGSQIAIIGGGPAGCFFAKFAAEEAEKNNLDVNITIFNSRVFSELGPRGCKGCVGVINERLNKKLKDNGIRLGEEVIHQRIDSYCLETRSGPIFLKKKTRMDYILTMFRGNGPLYSSYSSDVSFDGFLLRHALALGARQIAQPVVDVRLPETRGGKIEVRYGKDEVLLSDLVVGSFGVNTHLLNKFKDLGLGYLPPKTVSTYQAELEIGEKQISEHFGNTIYIYTLGIANIEYGIIIPKKNFLTVSIVGRNGVSLQDLTRFLKHPIVAQRFPKGWQMQSRFCHCKSKIPASTPTQPYGDRIIILGDPGFSRYYKNGIESAFTSAKIAAETIFKGGISKEAFRKYYYPRCRELFVTENFYGKILFKLNTIISTTDYISRAHVKVARKEQEKDDMALNNILWNMFTGHMPYRKIFRDLFNPRMQAQLTMNTASEFLRGLGAYW